MSRQHQSQLIKALIQKIDNIKYEPIQDKYTQGKKEGLETALRIVRNMK